MPKQCSVVYEYSVKCILFINFLSHCDDNIFPEKNSKGQRTMKWKLGWRCRGRIGRRTYSKMLYKPGAFIRPVESLTLSAFLQRFCNNKKNFEMLRYYKKFSMLWKDGGDLNSHHSSLFSVSARVLWVSGFFILKLEKGKRCVVGL